MKKFIGFLVVLILLVVVTVIAITFSEKTNEITENLFKVLAAFQSLLSVYIVYLLYDRYGTSKRILDTQNDLVIDFVTELKKINLNIITFHEEGKIIEFSIPLRRNLDFLTSDIDNSMKIMINKKDERVLERLVEIVRHPLFPRELVDTLDIFSFNIKTKNIQLEKEKFAFISYSNILEDQFNIKDWWMPNHGGMSVYDYLKRIEVMLVSIEDWVNNETSIKIKLNFE